MSEQRAHKRDDGPKLSISQDLEKRIKGLEEAKTYPGYSPQDVAALDRMIVKLKADLEYVERTKPQ